MNVPPADTMLQARIDAFCEHWAGQFMGQAATGEMLGKLAWRASHELGTPIAITVARNLQGTDTLVGYPLPPIPSVRGTTGAMGPMGPPAQRQQQEDDGDELLEPVEPFPDATQAAREAMQAPQAVEWACPDCNGTGRDQAQNDDVVYFGCITCGGEGRLREPLTHRARRLQPPDRDHIARIARWDALREQARALRETTPVLPRLPTAREIQPAHERLACEHGTPGCRGRGDKHGCNEPDPFGSNW